MNKWIEKELIFRFNQRKQNKEYFVVQKSLWIEKISELNLNQNYFLFIKNKSEYKVECIFLDKTKKEFLINLEPNLYIEYSIADEQCTLFLTYFYEDSI